MQLLTEHAHPYLFRRTKQLSEARKDVGKVLVVEGIFGKVNSRNENNRVYPHSVWQKNLAENSRFVSRLGRRAVLGECEHPESGNTHLQRVSHLITKVWVQELDESNIYGVEPATYIMGRAEILPTASGDVLRTLFECNVAVGISSRGRGDVQHVEGVDRVQDNYELDCWDFVTLPSVVEALPRPVAEAVEPSADLPHEPTLGEEPAETVPEVEPDAATEMAADWQASSEEIVRKLESLVGGADVAAMVSALPQAINTVDQLSSLDDAEAVKLKAQVTSLMRVLSRRIVELEGVGTEDTNEPKEPKAESIVIEGDYADLAHAVKMERDKDPAARDKMMYKGDVEAALNKAGHKVDDESVSGLADALRSAGEKVDDKTYGESKEVAMKTDELIEKLVARVSSLKEQAARTAKDSVPKVRYEQSKVLAAKLIERLKTERRRTKAMAQLMQHMVNEEKATKMAEYGKGQDKGVKMQGPALLKKQKMKTEAAEAPVKAPVVTESAQPKAEKAPAKVAKKVVPVAESVERRRRLRAMTESVQQAPSAPQAPALLSGVLSRIHQK